MDLSRSRNSRRKRKARTAGDFRRLNKFLKFNDYPLPIPEELVDEVSGDTVYMSSLDINKAYHQIKVEDEHGVLTIRARSGLYRFNVLPLGISPAVAAFQSTIENLLGENLLSSKVRVYLDDILIFSRTLEEHAYVLLCID